MTLAAGTRLGVFEILAPLGKGGMGEVYRAKDTKLGREVVLPEGMAKRPERMACSGAGQPLAAFPEQEAFAF